MKKEDKKILEEEKVEDTIDEEIKDKTEEENTQEEKVEDIEEISEGVAGVYAVTKDGVSKGLVQISHKAELEFYAKNGMKLEKTNKKNAVEKFEVKKNTAKTKKYMITYANGNQVQLDITDPKELEVFKMPGVKVEEIETK